MDNPEHSARAAAVRAMVAVTEGGTLLSEALPAATKGLPPADIARAGRLATGTFRWMNRCDRVLGPHLRLRPEDPVMHALRLAVYELFELGAAPHGVVNDAVSNVTRSKAGLVNGVLRNALRRDQDWTALPVPELPKWLRKPLVKAWGKPIVQDIERAHSVQPPLDLTVKNPSERKLWADKLGADLLPTGSLRLREAGQISTLPGYDEGAWWVQDAGAALAANWLAPQPGDRVLDLCAAPGGKTMQLASAGAKVSALDISSQRLNRVRENLSRTGLLADVVEADALKWEPKGAFDAVLIDAPCSATGTIRRHPELPFARNGEGLEKIRALQSMLLKRAWAWVRPGGRLVYCTCSLFPEEGEHQIEAFLEASPDASLAAQSGFKDSFHGPFGLRLRPDFWADKGGIDGFFVARLEKQP